MPLASAIRAAGSREFWVITLANLLVMTSYYLVFVVTAAYVRETWHTSLSVAGLAVGVMIMGCLVGRFVSGNLVSLLGCRKGSVRPCQPLFSGLWHSPIASRPLAGRIFDRCGENVLPVPIFCLMPWHSFFLPRRTAERCCFFRGCSWAWLWQLPVRGPGSITCHGDTIALCTSNNHLLHSPGSRRWRRPLAFRTPCACLWLRGMYMALSATTLAALVLYYLVHGRKLRFVRQ